MAAFIILHQAVFLLACVALMLMMCVYFRYFHSGQWNCVRTNEWILQNGE